MPSKSDIITAIKNSNVSLKVSELKDATVKLNSNGLPYCFTGGFTMVFQLTKSTKKWAFRVWHIGFSQQKDRFQKISQYLEKQKLPYFADFIYDEKGLLVNGEFVDTIRMEWLEGDLLKKFIEKNLRNGQKIQNLAGNFLKMCEELYNHQISHGDLQHGNILIDNNGNIKLIDYDSVCVPDIEGKEELVTGLKGYQHPSRLNTATKCSLKADYFSELIICLSLCAFAEKPDLWDNFYVKDTEVLLFSEEDLADRMNSKIYKELDKINSDNINSLLNILDSYLDTPNYLNLKPFCSCLTPEEKESIVTIEIPPELFHPLLTPDEKELVVTVKISPEPIVPPPFVSKFCNKCGRRYNTSTSKFCDRCGKLRY
jgi:serine/threonine protein kinase